ncbi:isoprenylcysteine carboxylmethyltransferase family protein (plasmid) [Mesorhizobium mediterraneum]|uniref:Sodium:proton antiporter n=2 Tax=Phyllobacteriaceae TaxID=69277 RepID=A0AB36RGR6_9HYPH|nr:MULTISPECIES: isoprenylcysteine carboxylmethyltransferase family protein [Mesorhizobium]PAQ03916.1 sodium:proton antiporter [Mesorhizobium mediterraneum]RWN24223.1 MAG: isoprenylcysteine carboxylmethyltransferase family protein [Mesorhizobium sp.]RWN27665.1 MAG: isoprenylcysteine carboxylmethyltransferase family protein [Mesorhizobium sp.]RWO06716.1 MAG: isoprenylcysteine carboxylmethyltransferase family protein [Mesorhizobium sp.]RWO23819.1 MAG: isoprenylcysteine carboxylmethyltransferase 
MMSASIAPQPFNQRKRLLVVRALSIAAIGSLLFSRPGWDEASSLHEVVEMIGFVLILVCILGRLWSILYVGGRKNSELAVSGPYSITRNPLYLFSTIGAFGIGLMFGSLIVASALGVCTYAVFGMTARKEETFLRDKFGPEFEAYVARTPRFWPKPWLHQDKHQHTFSTSALRSTFFDALYFLAIFPAIEGIEYLQVAGYLPTFFWLF